MAKKSKLVRISLHGVNLSRIYRECQNANITLFDIERKDYKNIEFDINAKDKKQIENIAKKQNYAILEHQNYGNAKITNFFKWRFGLLIGFLIFVVLNIVSNFFVWDIKIYGNQYVTNEEVLAVLQQNNISKGKIISGINPQKVENSLTDNLEKISMCSVIKKGTTVIVNIKEKLLASEAKNINGDVDIVAQTNLTITDLNVTSGTALKKVGDSVKAGEIIVAGYIEDSNGNKVPCNANAQIKAKTWHFSSETYLKQIEVKTRTGNKRINSKLQIFGMNFQVKNDNCDFENFEAETSEKYISNNFLPFKMLTTTYFEVTSQFVQQNFDADKQSVVEKCEKNALLQVKSDEVISKTFYVVDEKDDCFIVTSYVEVTFEF